jgi:hypothetical protein
MSKYITKDWLSAELQKVHSVVVYINPQVSGVKAPASLTSKPSFALLLSHHGDRPLIFREKDLKSDFLFEDGFEACTIPWKSIWAAHPEGEGSAIVFWNEHSPGPGWDNSLREYLNVPLTEEPAKPTKVESLHVEASTKKELKSRSHLRLVK